MAYVIEMYCYKSSTVDILIENQLKLYCIKNMHHTCHMYTTIIICTLQLYIE